MDRKIQPFDRLVGYQGSKKSIMESQWYKEKIVVQARLIAEAHRAASNQDWEAQSSRNHPTVVTHRPRSTASSSARPPVSHQPSQQIARQDRDLTGAAIPQSLQQNAPQSGPEVPPVAARSSQGQQGTAQGHYQITSMPVATSSSL